MRVWIVTYDNGDGEDYCGVFSTKERAEEWVEKTIVNRPYAKVYYEVSEQEVQ